MFIFFNLLPRPTDRYISQIYLCPNDGTVILLQTIINLGIHTVSDFC